MGSKKRLNLEKNFLANKYSNNLIDKKYDVLYDREFIWIKKLLNRQNKNLIFNFLSNSKKVRFFIYSVSYLINFILPSLFLILAVIVNKNSLAAEIGIVSGF